MRFNYKRKTYPAVKIGDVFYVRDKDFLKSKCYKEYKKLKEELKHKNQLWKSAFRAYKNLKKKVENKLFPVEFLDVGRTIIPDMPDFKNNVVYKFLIPWQKVKEYMLKKYKRGEK